MMRPIPGPAGFTWYELPGGTLAAFDRGDLCGGVFRTTAGDWTGGGYGLPLRRRYATPLGAMHALRGALRDGAGSGEWRCDVLHPGWAPLARRRGWSRPSGAGFLTVGKLGGEWTACLDGIPFGSSPTRQGAQAFADAYVMEGPSPDPRDETCLGMADLEEPDFAPPSNPQGTIPPMPDAPALTLTLPPHLAPAPSGHASIALDTTSTPELALAVRAVGYELCMVAAAGLCALDAAKHDPADRSALADVKESKARLGGVWEVALRVIHRAQAAGLDWRTLIREGVPPVPDREHAADLALALAGRMIRAEAHTVAIRRRHAAILDAMRTGKSLTSVLPLPPTAWMGTGTPQ